MKFPAFQIYYNPEYEKNVNEAQIPETKTEEINDR